MVHDTAKYFKRLKQLHPTHALLFSLCGAVPITARVISYHFERLLQAADIQNVAERDLVPYSFRHYFITQKVNANMPLVSIAEMCGTSISQIEKTYYHTTLDKMVLNALGGWALVFL